MLRDGSGGFAAGSIEATTVTVGANTSEPAFSVSQTGVGLVALFGDSADPDTPLVAIDDEGRLLIGTATPVTLLNQPRQFQINANSSAAFASICRWQNGNFGPGFVLAKSRGTEIGELNAVLLDDVLGGFYMGGDDGSTMNSEAATFTCRVDGPVATGSIPARFEWSTTGIGETSATVKMRLFSSGALALGGSAPGTTAFRISKPLTGAASANAIWISSQIQADITSTANMVTAQSAQAGGGTLQNVRIYSAEQGVLGGLVSNQYGFAAQANIVGATNN